MTKEDKQLLIKDLCARLPYGVKINIRNGHILTMEDVEMNPIDWLNAHHFDYCSLIRNDKNK